MSGSNAVVINFYEKIDPPPKFATFLDGWHNLGKHVRKLDYFIATSLHTNVDPNGKFKYVNYATFNDSNGKVLQDMTQPSPELLQTIMESHGPPGLQTNYPGGYHEILTSGGSAVAPDLDINPGSCFLIQAFRATADSDSLDVKNNIDLLTRVEMIKQTMPTGPWALYKRFTPAVPFQPFDYVFRIELPNTDLAQARDLAQRLAQEPTMEGVERSNTDLYKIDPNDVIKHE